MRSVVERLLNLLAFLLTAGRPVSADEIRFTVAGYDQSNDDAFHRMFERDKGILRRLGIPLQRKPTDVWEVEFGYMIAPDEYRLPDAGLTDEELAALSLAAQVVRMGGQPSGPEALFKLGGIRGGGGEPLAADLGAVVELLGDLFAAVAERRVVSFDYRAKHRQVHPYGLVHQRGHWYLVGAEGGEERAFRVDKAETVHIGSKAGAFAKPSSFRLREALPQAPWEAGGEDLVATVRFDPEVAWWAERQLSREAKVMRRKDGGVTVTMPVANLDAFVGWVIGFGASAEVTGPAALRRRVVERVGARR